MHCGKPCTYYTGEPPINSTRYIVHNNYMSFLVNEIFRWVLAHLCNELSWVLNIGLKIA